MRIAFATDLHGSTEAFRLLLRAISRGDLGVDLLILGGDLVGKRVSLYSAISDDRFVRRTRDGLTELSSLELDDWIRASHSAGSYCVQADESVALYREAPPDLYEAVLFTARAERLEQWLRDLGPLQSSTRIIVNLGNDDPFELDALFGHGSLVLAEGKLIDVGEGVSVVSCGYTNTTPWNAPRDEDDSALAVRLSKLPIPSVGEVVANFHCPPFGSGLDDAVVLDKNLKPTRGLFGPVKRPVGAKAVRDWIATNQPVLTLHGHIHEVQGSVSLGRTRCVNPGSDYLKGFCNVWMGTVRDSRVLNEEFVQLRPSPRVD